MPAAELDQHQLTLPCLLGRPRRRWALLSFFPRLNHIIADEAPKGFSFQPKSKKCRDIFLLGGWVSDKALSLWQLLGWLQVFETAAALFVQLYLRNYCGVVIYES